MSEPLFGFGIDEGVLGGLAGIIAALYFLYLAALVLIFGGELNREDDDVRLVERLGRAKPSGLFQRRRRVLPHGARVAELQRPFGAGRTAGGSRRRAERGRKGARRGQRQSEIRPRH